MGYLAAVPPILSTVGTLANMYNQNKWAKKNYNLRKDMFDMQMDEHKFDRSHSLERERLADLYNLINGLEDQKKNRLDTDYGYFVRNLIGGKGS